MISCKKYLENINDGFKNKGYVFNNIEEMNIITISNKMEMTYDFFIIHNIHAIERKLNAMVNKNKSFINTFCHNWRHPLYRKFEKYRV